MTCLWQIPWGVFIWNEALNQVRASREPEAVSSAGRGHSRMTAAAQRSWKKASLGEWRDSRRDWPLSFGEGAGSEGHWREGIFRWQGRLEAASPGDHMHRWGTAERPSCLGRMAHSFPESTSTWSRGSRRQNYLCDSQELNDIQERMNQKPV